MSEIYKKEKHPISGRLVMFEDDGTSAWLYLSSPSGEGIEKDAFAYSPIEPLEELNKSEIENGEPPKLIKSLVTPSSVIVGAIESDFSFRWSKNGESVALFHKGEAISTIYQNYKSGYSKSLSKASPFGNPWDNELYESEF